MKTRAHNLSMDVNKKKIHTYSSSEWPTFGVWWPPEGIFHLPTLLAVEDRVLKKTQGHPEHHCLERFGCQLATLGKILLIAPNLCFFASRNSVCPDGKRTKAGSPQIIKSLYPILQTSRPEEVIFPLHYSRALTETAVPVSGGTLHLPVHLPRGDFCKCFHSGVHTWAFACGTCTHVSTHGDSPNRPSGPYTSPK